MNEIPHELHALITQVRQQYPELAIQSDEAIAMLIIQVLETQQTEIPTKEEDLRHMHPDQLQYQYL